MKAIGNAIARGALAMAGRRSPWGGGGKGEQEPAQGSGETGAQGGEEPAPGGPDGKPDPAPDAAPGPRNPWLPPSEGPRRSASIEDIFRARRTGTGKGGGSGSGGGTGFPRLPERPGGKSWLPVIGGGVALLWLAITCTHQLGSTQEGIVTTFGKYSHTIGSGVSLTMPWPFQDVVVEEVTKIRRDSIPEGEAEKLMLTSDQNLVDFSYLVRWNIKDLKLYKYQLDDPDTTVKEVAEAAMRASVAEVSLSDVMSGAGRAQIEQSMRSRMQAILDAYHSGVLIQGVDIKKANPPQKVIDAFQDVTVAQQEAQGAKSNAEAWAQQVTARAQGDAAAFDKVYEQYKLAPDVTRRRMYYETMERVLSNNDKVVVETGSGVTSYLPLPEIRRRSADDPAAAAASAVPALPGGR